MTDRARSARPNSGLGVSVALVALAMAVSLTVFSGAAQVAMLAVLGVGLVAVVARGAANRRTERR